MSIPTGGSGSAEEEARAEATEPVPWRDPNKTNQGAYPPYVYTQPQISPPEYPSPVLSPRRFPYGCLILVALLTIILGVSVFLLFR